MRGGVSGRAATPPIAIPRVRETDAARTRPLYWGGSFSSMLSARAARRRSEARAAFAACCSRRSSRTWLGLG